MAPDRVWSPGRAPLRTLARAVERLLLPAECLLCRAPVDGAPEDPLVCALCRARWGRLPHPQCPRCGQPALLPELPCRTCPGWPPGLTRVRSAVWFDGPVRQAVHHLKYDGWWRVTEAMAEAMRGLEPLHAGALLVPVPVTARRLRQRGYNQSEVLARALPGRVAAGALVRVRDTATQTALTPEERAANVAGAFRVLRAPPGPVVLVDDVFTTGATLVEAAAALLAAGTGVVEAVTFARARPVMPGAGAVRGRRP